MVCLLSTSQPARSQRLIASEKHWFEKHGMVFLLGFQLAITSLGKNMSALQYNDVPTRQVSEGFQVRREIQLPHCHVYLAAVQAPIGLIPKCSFSPNISHSICFELISSTMYKTRTFVPSQLAWAAQMSQISEKFGTPCPINGDFQIQRETTHPLPSPRVYHSQVLGS